MSTKPPDRFLSLFRIEHGLLQVFRGHFWFTLPLQSRYTIDGRQVSGSKLHWYLYHGVWPEHRIYFADGDKLNYSKENMVDVRERTIGRLKPYQAVCRDSTGKLKHLGYFLTQEERDAALATFKQMRASGLV